MTAQLDICESIDISSLSQKVKEYKESADNVRRGIFARFDSHKNELGKMFLDLHIQVENLKSEIEILKKKLE